MENEKAKYKGIAIYALFCMVYTTITVVRIWMRWLF